jgi:hypothetical protein
MRTPVFFINYAMYEVFPPGAAAISMIFSFIYGASAITGKNDDALYKM